MTETPPFHRGAKNNAAADFAVFSPAGWQSPTPTHPHLHTHPHKPKVYQENISGQRSLNTRPRTSSQGEAHARTTELVPLVEVEHARPVRDLLVHQQRHASCRQRRVQRRRQCAVRQDAARVHWLQHNLKGRGMGGGGVGGGGRGRSSGFRTTCPGFTQHDPLNMFA